MTIQSSRGGACPSGQVQHAGPAIGRSAQQQGHEGVAHNVWGDPWATLIAHVGVPSSGPIPAIDPATGRPVRSDEVRRAGSPIESGRVHEPGQGVGDGNHFRGPIFDCEWSAAIGAAGFVADMEMGRRAGRGIGQDPAGPDREDFLPAQTGQKPKMQDGGEIGMIALGQEPVAEIARADKLAAGGQARGEQGARGALERAADDAAGFGGPRKKGLGIAQITGDGGSGQPIGHEGIAPSFQIDGANFADGNAEKLGEPAESVAGGQASDSGSVFAAGAFVAEINLDQASQWLGGLRERFAAEDVAGGEDRPAKIAGMEMDGCRPAAVSGGRLEDEQTAFPGETGDAESWGSGHGRGGRMVVGLAWGGIALDPCTLPGDLASENRELPRLIFPGRTAKSLQIQSRRSDSNRRPNHYEFGCISRDRERDQHVTAVCTLPRHSTGVLPAPSRNLWVAIRRGSDRVHSLGRCPVSWLFPGSGNQGDFEVRHGKTRQGTITTTEANNDMKDIIYLVRSMTFDDWMGLACLIVWLGMMAIMAGL